MFQKLRERKERFWEEKNNLGLKPSHFVCSTSTEFAHLKSIKLVVLNRLCGG
jgi:hypothetical protein